MEDGVVLKRTFTAPETPARPLTYPNKKKGSRVRLNHLIEIDDFRFSTLVVGLARPSISFSARKLINGGNITEENLKPMRQLAHLCCISQTRYGYILTDEDLVACRFSASDPNTSASVWEAEIMPIPWSKNGPTQLTTDLALWWLCMLALSGPHNRVVTRPDRMVNVDGWEPARRDDDEQGWTERHWYSKFERPAVESPPAYATPAPDDVQGQAAAFQAAVGLNANDDFAIDPNFVVGDFLNVDSLDFDFNFGAGNQADH